MFSHNRGLNEHAIASNYTPSPRRGDGAKRGADEDQAGQRGQQTLTEAPSQRSRAENVPRILRGWDIAHGSRW